jgi:hypothetical protein
VVVPAPAGGGVRRRDVSTQRPVVQALVAVILPTVRGVVASHAMLNAYQPTPERQRLAACAAMSECGNVARKAICKGLLQGM